MIVQPALALLFAHILHTPVASGEVQRIRVHCAARWGLRRHVQLRATWGLRRHVQLRATWGELRPLGARLAAPWGDTRPLRAQLTALYGNTVPLRTGLVAAWRLSPTNPVRARVAASWRLADDGRLQQVAGLPALVWGGRVRRVLHAELSCDEGSPVWIAQIELADMADFSEAVVGTPVQLHLGTEVFALVVDGRSFSRPEEGEPACRLSAISPLALLDAPWSGEVDYTEHAPRSARTLVESFVGPVGWQMPDWIVPAGRLAVAGATRLVAARQVAGALRGVVESAPDGSLLCRRTHPVSVPDYGAAQPAHVFDEADIFELSEHTAPARGYNRVTVSNDLAEASAGVQDRIEYSPAPDDPHAGTVHVYPAPRRALALVHSGHPATVLTALGERVRIESETVEFVEGVGETRYPVEAIVSRAWQHAHLGDVVADGRKLSAALPGYSLLRLSYAVRSLDWRVALAASEEVQFYVIEV